jgi:transcription-repair coupling factor (superfamily II helicase)
MRALLGLSLNHPVLYVAGDAVAAKTMYKTFSELCDKCIYLPEKYDFLTYKQSINFSSSAPRIRAIFDLITGNYKVAVVTVESLMQYFPNKDLFLSLTFTLKKDVVIDYKTILNQLINMGCTRVDKVENKAEFAVYGDIIDIFPIDNDLPIRIMLFDDTIEAIKQFAPDSMMINAEFNEYTFLPVADMMMDRLEIDNILKLASTEIQLHSKKSRLREILDDLTLRVSSINVSEALWWLIPFAKKNLSTIADIISGDTVIFYEEARLIDDKARLINNELKARLRNLILEEEILPIHAEIMINKDTVYEVLSNKRKIATMPPTTINPIFNVYNIYNFKSITLPKYYMNRSQLLEDLKAYMISGYAVIVSAGDLNKANAYSKSLISDDIGCSVVESAKIKELKGIIVSDLKKSGFAVI